MILSQKSMSALDRGRNASIVIACIVCLFAIAQPAAGFSLPSAAPLLRGSPLAATHRAARAVASAPRMCANNEETQDWAAMALSEARRAAKSSRMHPLPSPPFDAPLFPFCRVPLQSPIGHRSLPHPSRSCWLLRRCRHDHWLPRPPPRAGLRPGSCCKPPFKLVVKNQNHYRLSCACHTQDRTVLSRPLRPRPP